MPTRWGEEHNLLWKTPLRGLGTSTPIVWGDRLFLTSQVGRGEVETGGSEFPSARPSRKTWAQSEAVLFLAQAFSTSDGRLLWEHQLEADPDLPPVHRKHNLASPSCVTDGKLVYAWFGTGQLVALSLEGQLVWSRHLGQDYGRFAILWGHGSSPVLYRDLLLLLCDHPSGAYLLALDKSSGQERWKTDRGKNLRSYTTPLVISTESGHELIVNSAPRIDAYDPATGRLLWYAGQPNRVPVPSPVFAGGILYTSRGYSSGPFMAIRPGGRGDVSETHVRWQIPTGAPYVSSLLYYQGLVYMATERGIVRAVDAGNGETVWRQRLGAAFSASPLGADGRVYFLSENGETFVVKAGRQFELLASNHLNQRCLASPAVAGGRIFIRSDDYLFCIGQAGDKGG